MRVQFLCACLIALVASQSSHADLVITEIMQNPASVADTSGEWFEIFNSGPTIIDLNGFSFSDGGTNSFTVGVSLISNPGDYLVFGRNDDSMTNGGVTVDFEYSGFVLGNDDDEIIITDASNAEVDRVEYDGGPQFPDPEGASMFLTGTDSTVDNNLGSNWSISTAPFGDGDLGTPGSGNFTFTAVPEPSAFLFGTLICGVLGAKVSRKRTRS